ncbi:heterogeneous nuclear ribonucleoprotein U-like protein 2 isoform X1 [Sinocyclocheilus anshuiensis]|uniref:Heterogeneous nuclear ribonucleoprotein U-like protein 2 n=1 Tax=Sinocyclocheilus anshuiensis TaxID=1608454 RepID=A0A671RAJ3_9TELE|nr:PREDICTED: heterogeneous nuclear ribonucleoprotein U-like protein 2 isoform X1 [Sinocyclocheilus anshuiensis]
MLLAEVKRLKVAELRAMLTERGLDSRGLKAELVVRLISAIEAGVEPIKSADEGRNGSETKSEEPQKTHSPESEQCVRTRSPVCIGPPKKSMTAYTDQSTQTDPLQLCSCTAPIAIAKAAISGEERQQQAYPQHPAANLHPVALATAATEDAESGCSSSVLAISEPEAAQQQEQLLRRLSDGPETVDSTPDESRELKRPVEERGRDYYEFKEDIHYNRAKTPELLPEPEEEAEIDFEDVRLDSYSCDLHFEVDSDGSSGQPLFWETFPLLWSGCRMSHGFCQGKVGFEAKFVKRLSAPALDTSCDPDRHVLRVGWSVDNTSLQLGEVELSYGFDGRGRIVTGAKEEAFGEPFTEGDVIGCYAFISETGEAMLSFHKNGRSLGVAFHLNSSTLGGQDLFPHVLCKNCSVSVNLDPEAPWHPFPAGFCTLLTLPHAQSTRALLPTASKSDCEVLMMIGLPGSGKTHWAQAHMLQNPRKRYNLLSTNSILNCMRELPGANRRELMLQQATQCVSQLIRRAAAKRRNYILDQSNIYQSARRHKMLCFHGYQRRAVVVLPPDEVWRRRLVQRQEQEGTALQETSLLKAKVSFTLPELGEHLDQVMFVELSSDEALKLLTHYKEEARHLLPTPPKRKKHRRGSQNSPVHQCGWRGGPFGSHYTSQKAQGRHPSALCRSYGCSSDPQRYRNYYRPYTGQWSSSEQNQSRYGSVYYGCSS